MATHKMEWNAARQRWEWTRTSDGAPEAPRPSPNPLQPGDRATVGFGTRPKRGENAYKPSESLQRSLRNSQLEMEEAERQKQRAVLEQKLRDLDAGRIIVDPDATLATPVVRVDEGDKTRYVRADRMDPAEKARIERQREDAQDEKRRKQAAEIAARMKERGTVASDLAAVGRPLPAPGVFITEEAGSQLPLIPAQPDASTRGVDRVEFQTWTPMRNTGKKFI
jgi:hypothetical protein